MSTYLDFEQGIAELEGKAEELKALARRDPEMDIAEEVSRLSEKSKTQLADLYNKLTPWRKTLVARHPARPHAIDYINELIDEFTPLAGDRGFAEDLAMLSGIGRFRGQAVIVLGHEKGKDTNSRIKRNFGMARPEGYRKAIRLMDMADRFNLPVLTFVDTPGAYPGKGAEERGQAEAIARCTEKCLEIKVPIISAITGEGGSGGAVAIATANRVLMLEHAIYSVISPEGCASILWKSAEKAEDAAAALKLTAQDLLELGVIDAITKEPIGGAHRKPSEAINALGDAIEAALLAYKDMSGEAVQTERRQKFLMLGRSGA